MYHTTPKIQIIRKKCVAFHKDIYSAHCFYHTHIHYIVTIATVSIPVLFADDTSLCHARIEHATERVEQVMGTGKGGSILVLVGTNNADREGTTVIVKKYRDLLKRTKQARVGQIILSGILPVIGGRNQGYRNSRRMAINILVQQICEEEDVGFVDLWSNFVAKEEMYYEGWTASERKGSWRVCQRLETGSRQGIGQRSYLN